jgi:3-methylfumaryl-CoA hydratase
MERWRDWIGRETVAEDRIGADRAQALQATLDDPGPPLRPGDPLPPLWHWIYFWTVAPAATLGPDGHPERGGLLPPIELPRRMWAGSRVTFRRALQVGAAATRRSRITEVQLKEGRSGPLAFVTVRHEISAGGEACIEEEHDIVYRAAPVPGEQPPPGEPAPTDAPWRREVTADPVLLFRYSALTFNGHRIHYDLKHATGTEGYPGLVVHGPLLATLMLELLRAERPAARVTAFRFRAIGPIFDTAPFTLAGRPADGGKSAELWIAGPDGTYATRGSVDLA